MDSYRMPQGEKDRAQRAVTIGGDGDTLLEAVHAAGAPSWLRAVPAVQILRSAWIQQYYRDQDQGVSWREGKDLPPARLRLSSPYDVDARYGMKRGNGWCGYQAHFTETCEDAKQSGTPHVITQVATTEATLADQEVTGVLHAGLTAGGLSPGEHDVDAGYISAELLLTSTQAYGIELLGPVGADTRWQGKNPDAFDTSHFTLDWDAGQVRCPPGAASSTWRVDTSRGLPLIRVDFRKRDRTPCPVRARCTTSATSARKLTLRPRAQHEAIDKARHDQETDAWKDRYQVRAGVQGTLSQAVRATAIRRSRYIGLPKTHLAHVFAATPLNLIRLDAWWTGTPLGGTRTSHLTTLHLEQAA